MNAVGRRSHTDRARQTLDPDEFPSLFPKAFDNKAVTIKRLCSGTTNNSDLGGVLQRTKTHSTVGCYGKGLAHLFVACHYHQGD